MTKYLVIVESPTKEKTLKKILGRDYTIKSSKGHLIDLPKTKLGIDVENNFQPEYVVIPKQRRVLKELEESTKGKEKGCPKDYEHTKLLFMLMHPRRNKAPHLIQNHRETGSNTNND